MTATPDPGRQRGTTPDGRSAVVAARGRRPGLPERRLVVKGLDLAAVALAWWLFLRPGGDPGPSPAAAAASLAALGFFWLLAAEGARAYPPEAGRSGGGDRPPAGDGSGAGSFPVFLPGPALVAAGLLFLVRGLGSAAGLAPGPALPGWPAVVAFPAGLLVLPGALRLVARRVLDRPELRPAVVVVGSGTSVREQAASLRRHGRGLYRGVDVVETGGELANRVAEGDVDVIALARPTAVGDDTSRELDRCVEAGIEVVALAELRERLTGRVHLDHLEGAAGGLPLSPPAVRAVHRVTGRALDLALVAVGLAFFLPVLPLLAAAVRLETPGPVFYTQERVGRGGRTFRVYKLRSMVADAEAEGEPRWAEEEDPRITRVGRVLRATHLDEFPQMFNIVKGEMSPVGPRPERPEFVEDLDAEIPHYRMRHAVRPGMAGWALVEHGYASSLEDARRKHEYDLYYVKHRSVWMDLVVLARTIVDTVTFGGR